MHDEHNGLGDPEGGPKLATVTDLAALREVRATKRSVSPDERPLLEQALTVTPITPAGVPSRIEALDAAERRILKRLRRADRSREELRRELAVDEFLDEDGIDELLDRLAELGYIDDVRMAESLADTLLDRRGKGLDGVRRELRGRLLDDDVIAEALEGRERDDEFGRAAALAQGRAERLRGVERDTALRRLTGFLQRRGFSSRVAFIAAGDALDGVDRPSTTGGSGGASRGGSTNGVFFGNTDND